VTQAGKAHPFMWLLWKPHDLGRQGTLIYVVTILCVCVCVCVLHYALIVSACLSWSSTDGRRIHQDAKKARTSAEIEEQFLIPDETEAQRKSQKLINTTLCLAVKRNYAGKQKLKFSSRS
jgi:hypothetical protein